MVFLPESPTGSQPRFSGSQKPIALASRTSFFRHLSIPGGYRNRSLRCHSLVYPDGVDSPSIRPSMLAIKRLVKWLSASSNQIIQGMLDQPSARRHQSLLQARQRPVSKGRREPRGGGRGPVSYPVNVGGGGGAIINPPARVDGVVSFGKNCRPPGRGGKIGTFVLWSNSLFCTRIRPVRRNLYLGGAMVVGEYHALWVILVMVSIVALFCTMRLVGGPPENIKD